MESPLRKIIHVDMDAFYASVEQRDNPRLKGQPVIVGGRPDGRGVVCSASYEARKFGVKSAMSSSKAYRLCPRAVFVRPDFSKYKAVSNELHRIFTDYTDLVEPLSLDEAYLDVTANKIGEPLARKIAEQIRFRIQSELGLTASAGVGPNKFIAKVASDFKKPNGLVVIPPERVLAFVEKLPVERLWGVGPATAKRLKELGYHTANDLKIADQNVLMSHLGKFGNFLFRLANGEDNRPVNPDRTPKSRGAETTFERDVMDLKTLKEMIDELAKEVAQSLQRHQMPGKTIVLKVKYSDFTSITRSRTIAHATTDEKQIAETAVGLLSATEATRRPIRLIGVSVGNLVSNESVDAEDEETDQLVLPGT